MSECGENASPPVWLDVCRCRRRSACHVGREAFLKKLHLPSQSQSVYGATLHPQGGNKPNHGVSLTRRLPSECVNGFVVFSYNRYSAPLNERATSSPLVTLPSLLEPGPLLYFSSQCLAAAVAAAVAGSMCVGL